MSQKFDVSDWTTMAEFKTATRNMNDAYYKLQSNLEEEEKLLKEKESAKNNKHKNRHKVYKEFEAKASRKAKWRRIIFGIILYLVLNRPYSMFIQNKIAQPFDFMIAVLCLVTCIVIPILFIKPKKILSRITKKSENIRLLAEADEADTTEWEYSFDSIDHKLNQLKEKRPALRKEADEYSDLYNLWYEDVKWARENIPAAYGESDWRIITLMAQHIPYSDQRDLPMLIEMNAFDRFKEANSR